MVDVTVDGISIGNRNPMTLIGGMNVIESRDIALHVAEEFANITEELGIPFIFKASFDKANRSSIHSFRGPGLDEGLKVLYDTDTSYSSTISL